MDYLVLTCSKNPIPKNFQGMLENICKKVFLSMIIQKNDNNFSNELSGEDDIGGFY